MFVGMFGEHFRSDVMDVISHMGCKHRQYQLMKRQL